MAKKNKIIRNRKKPIKRISRDGIYLGDVKIKDIQECLDSLKASNPESSSNITNVIQNNLTKTVVSVLWLAQIRHYNSNFTSDKVEQIPSYRHIKRQLILNPDSPAITAAATAALTVSLAFFDIENANDFVEAAEELAEDFTPNARYYPDLSRGNYMIFCAGHMSRTVGIFGSCPASNIKIFNFPAEALQWKLIDLVKALGPTAAGLSLPKISQEIRQEILRSSGGFIQDNLIFPEPEMEIPLEKDILQEGDFSRTGQPEKLTRTGSIPDEDIKLLSKFEAFKLKQAMEIGASDTVNKLKAKIIKIRTASNPNPEI